MNVDMSVSIVYIYIILYLFNLSIKKIKSHREDASLIDQRELSIWTNADM